MGNNARVRVIVFDDVVHDFPSHYPMPSCAEILVFDSVDDATERVREFQPHLVFLDQNLAGRERGLDALLRMSRELGEAMPPVYACSTVRRANEAMVSAGASGMVDKGEIGRFIQAFCEETGR